MNVCACKFIWCILYCNGTDEGHQIPLRHWHHTSIYILTYIHTYILKPMTHPKVTCENHLCKKLSQENLRKLPARVLHDTLASWTTKVVGWKWRFVGATVLWFWPANHSSQFTKENFQEQNSFYLWKLTFASKNLRKCVCVYATCERFFPKWLLKENFQMWSGELPLQQIPLEKDHQLYPQGEYLFWRPADTSTAC